MPANKRDTAVFSADAGIGLTDLARLDAHGIRPEEYDDIPELTEDWFAEADLHEGGRLVRRGRPKLDRPKAQVTLRLDRDLLDGLRATGPGWQSRVNEALKAWLRDRAA